MALFWKCPFSGVDFMSLSIVDGFNGWPDEATVIPVSRIRLEVLPQAHPLFEPSGREIETNWKREVEANPALFDGQMVFFRRFHLSGDTVHGEGHVVGYSGFLWWRRQVDRDGGIHAFAYPVLAGSDGALVAITMGPHTANPGQVYFAAGSLEPQDVVDGRCDLEANMRREVLEETGLDLAACRTGQGYHALRLDRTIVICKLYFFDITADEISARISEHIATGKDDEICGAVVIRSADPTAYRYNAAMLPVIDWFFKTVRT
jgi:8-oxo-dGTP pyrophosphatase MutT (NUDIX family)